MAGVPAAGGATSKVHTIKWADAYAQFFTFAVERPAQIWEVPSVVPYKLNIKVAEGFMKGVISLRGSPWTNASAVNTATQMDAITYVDTDGTRRIKLGQGVVWMNAESGAALQASDKIDVSEIEVDYERPIDAIPVAGTDGIMQPSQPDFSKIVVKLKLPRANATNLAYLATFQAGTPQKMTITFTGPLIEVDHYYRLVLGFTKLVLMDPPDAPLDPMISNTLTFEFQESAAAPTGMTGHVRPFLTLENLASADYLA
jgi:hypothetical protein